MELFLTVGAQMPFDRLVRALDAWAGQHPEHHVLAQIGDSEVSPAHLEAVRFLGPEEFARAYDRADVVVGHAGIGTLFAAMERAKPLVVLPRRAALRETRNDHQIATAKRFERFDGVYVAWEESELPDRLEEVRLEEVQRDGVRRDGVRPGAAGRPSLGLGATSPLIDTIAAFISRA